MCANNGEQGCIKPTMFSKNQKKIKPILELEIQADMFNLFIYLLI